MKPVILCAGKKCCPVLSQIAADRFQIADDYGATQEFSRAELQQFYSESKKARSDSKVSFGKVTMHREQALELGKVI